MSDVAELLHRFGGVASTAELRGEGCGKRMLAVAVASGRIVRQRIGHYCLPNTPEEIVQALRVGGRICCVSAARIYGLRVLQQNPPLHVSVDANDSRFRSRGDRRVRFRPAQSAEQAGIVLHWADYQLSQDSRRTVQFEDCLVQIIGCRPALDAICTLDSALEPPRHGPNRGIPLLDAAGLARVRSRVSRIKRTSIVDRATGLSQAVGETVARCNFEDAGIPVVPQAPLPGNFAGDLLIGEWLLFECNGEGPHTGGTAFDRDHSRYAWLLSHGFHIVRFSHNQILYEWPMVLSTVRLLMRRGLHLHPF